MIYDILYIIYYTLSIIYYILYIIYYILYIIYDIWYIHIIYLSIYLNICIRSLKKFPGSEADSSSDDTDLPEVLMDQTTQDGGFFAAWNDGFFGTKKKHKNQRF